MNNPYLIPSYCFIHFHTFIVLLLLFINLYNYNLLIHDTIASTNILKLQIRNLIGILVNMELALNFVCFFFFAEGLMGMAVAGGVIIGVASILGLGIAMAKKN